MFHHSFEHVPDPKETLKSVARLLSEDGHCIIRIPTVSSYAWEHYGVNWVQLDAPRHFYLHSSESMHHIAGLAGLEIYDAVYDSTSFQFTGSEQYLQDIPLHDLASKGGIELSKAEIKDYNQKAKALNKDNRGDQAVFYIRKQRIT